MKTTLEEILGLPFINTIAADKHGDAFYADIGTVPHVMMDKLVACAGSFVAQIFTASGVIALDGTRSVCDWGNDPGTPQPGVLGPENLPSLIRDDYVTNSNDSYWLSNPDERLEGFSPLLRRDTFNEVSPRMLRTRMGLIQVQDRLAGADGLAGNDFDLERLQKVFYSNRNYSSELELDAMLDLCDSGSPPIDAWPTSGGGTVDATLACDVLAGWNRRDDLESVGVPIWRQFFGRLGRQVGKFSVPFDPADPINTPNTLTLNDNVITAFGDAIAELEGLGISQEAALGDVQYVTDDGEPRAPDDSNVIPMHGGSGQNGVFNVVSTSFGPDGYTPVTAGPTYMQTVTWDHGGQVVAEAILGFSQSDDPENPHYADQTRRYSTKEFIRLPFREFEIWRDLTSFDLLIDKIEVDME
jgi:acyl-homoserine-lactone acylase